MGINKAFLILTLLGLFVLLILTLKGLWWKSKDYEKQNMKTGEIENKNTNETTPMYKIEGFEKLFVLDHDNLSF